MDLKKVAYYLGIALCLASPLAFGICMLAGLDNTVPLSLMITSNACRICSLEAEMTENTMRRYKGMKLYKVTTINSYNVREVFTVCADSKYEAIMRAYDMNKGGNVAAIEEVD